VRVQHLYNISFRLADEIMSVTLYRFSQFAAPSG